jgi:oligosaccharide repeat unit polymerase
MISSVLWGSLMILYALHLSNLLLFSIPELLPVALAIWVPFSLVAFGSIMWRPRALRRQYKLRKPSHEQLVVIEKRLRFLWRLWLIAAAVETLVSGGLPILWIFTNPSKTYFDYGLPSLHGLVNSLMLALTLCRFALYLMTGNKRHLKVPFFSIVWWILLATRGTLLFTLVESAFLLLRIRHIRAKTLYGIAASVVLVVLLFGWAGDLRSGSDRFRELAQPTSSYPQWLPSGVLWVYIYATTPLNNLAYSMLSKNPEANLLLPHTLSLLLPTVVRNYVYGDAGAAADELTGDLIEANFNVSTAYLGPAQDFGLPAIFLFSLISASACQWFWYKPDLQSQLFFAVLAMCLFFSVFYDLFLSLPIVAQMGWFFLILRKRRTRISEKQVHRPLLSKQQRRLQIDAS